jgi:hypothetical protein
MDRVKLSDRKRGKERGRYFDSVEARDGHQKGGVG